MSCSSYFQGCKSRFRRYLDEIGIDLCGSILDVACGPVSLGCLYDGVHGHDNSPEFISILEGQGIQANLAEITDLDYPPESFRYVVSFNPPQKPLKPGGDIQAGVKRFVEDMLNIAQDKVIIRSCTMIPVLPPQYDYLIERKGRNFVVYWTKHPIASSDHNVHLSPSFLKI